jgi:hypothetical protein
VGKNKERAGAADGQAACRDQLGYQIEKLEAKYGAAISKLKELDPSLSEDRFRRSE